MQDIAAPLPQVLTARQGGSVTKYLRGLGLIGEQQGGAWQYPLPDALGSVRQLVDAQGQVQLAKRYDPFGGLESVTGLAQSAYGFAGEEQDSDTDHLFLRARTYNPSTGRFLQQDSVLGDPSQPQSLHRYAYGFSNPVNYTDPSGLMPPINAGPRLGMGNPAAAAYLIQQQSYAVQPGTQVSPQAQYTAQVRRLGYNAAYQGLPTTGGIPRVQVARSVNGTAGQNWQTGSDPYARSQSQGYRPAPCGPMKRSPLDPLFAIRDTGQWIIDGVKADLEAMKADPVGYNRKRAEDWFNWTVDGLQKGWDIFKRDTARLKQDLQNDLQYGLQTLRQDPARFARETAVATRRMWQQSRETISLTLDVIPVVGDIKGVVEGLVGVDLAGNEIGQHMRAVMVLAAIVGFFTFADEALAAGKLAGHLAGNADLAVDLLKSSKGLGHLDEGAGLAKHLDDGLLKQVPKVDDKLRSLRSLDEAAELNRLRNLDNFTGGGKRTVSNAAEMRQRLTSNSGSGALSQRLDDTPSLRGSGVCDYNSFTAGTPVHTDEGQKPIEAITLGDKVLAEDPETGEQGYFKVVALTNHPEDEILHITLESEQGSGGAGEQGRDSLDTTPSLTDNQETQPNSNDTSQSKIQNLKSEMEVTPEHPIYVEGQGWLWAENLSIGDTLRRADGGTAKVLAIERVKLDAPQLVYNFTVKGPHTYFVLEVGVLVHNAGLGDCGPYESYVQYLEPYSHPQKRVGESIPGLDVSIPLNESGLPDGWRIIEENALLDGDELRFIDTKVAFDFGDGTVGVGTFSRMYAPGQQRLTLRHAFLQDPNVPGAGRLPTWIENNISFPGREGIPTATFFTMYQMRKLGVSRGGLKEVKLSQVVNNNTVLHLQWLKTRYPKAKLKDLISQTHSVRYAETPLIQTGHKILPDSFKVNKVEKTAPLSYLRNAPERPANFEELEKYFDLHKLPGDIELPFGFDIVFGVKKFP